MTTPASTVESTSLTANTISSPALTGTAPQLFTQEQVWAAVEKARTEVKDELFGRIDTVQNVLKQQEDQIKVFNDERESRLAAEKAAVDKTEADRVAAEQEKLTLKQRFDASEQEWAARFAQMQEEMSRRDALLAKERELSELSSYRLTRISELREPNPGEQHFGIHDAFVDLIGGSSKEEIDASLATMVAKTRAIVEEVQQHQELSRTRMPGVSPTGGNIGPIEQQGSQRTYSADEIAAMSPMSEEYQKVRAAYGIGRSQSNRGILG